MIWRYCLKHFGSYLFQRLGFTLSPHSATDVPGADSDFDLFFFALDF